MTNPAPDNEQTREGIGNAIDLLPSCISRGVALLIRVSSTIQLKNIGSIEFQAAQIKHLTPYGATTDHLRVFDATDESAKVGADRPVFRELLATVRAGEVGVVVVTDVDRVARNDPDAEELYDALEEKGAILVVNGEIYDPANSAHRLILRIRTAVAQFENDQRVFRSLTARMTKARALKAHVSVGAGLIWASPDDPDFARRLRKQGLEHWIEPEALECHRTDVVKDGKRFFVFPSPDHEVRRACRLAMRWLFETGSLTGVLERIDSHPWWPRPGMFPFPLARKFRPDRPLFDWTPVTGRGDGKEELGRARLAGWFRSPSLYGIYRFNAERLKKISRAAAALGTSIREEDAFPAFAPSGAYDRALEILSNPDGGSIRARGSWDGPRNHSIPMMRCAHPMPNGQTCGRKMTAMYSTARKGKHRYLAVACGERGHRYSLPPEVDADVVDLVLTAFTRETLKGELERIQRRDGADEMILQRLQGEVEDLKARVDWDDERAFKARQEGDVEDVAYYDRQRKTHMAAHRRKKRELKRHIALATDTRRITDHELQEILDLASDLPELLSLAEGTEGKVREIMRELVRCVHARRLATGIYHLDVEFRSGARLSGITVSRSIRSTQPVRALAHARLRSHLDPERRATLEGENTAVGAAEQLAAELNEAMGALKTPWTADRVLAAAYLYVLKDENRSAPPDAYWRSPADWAKRLHLKPGKVRAAALRGRLGPGLCPDGRLVVAPTERALQKTFPDYARRAVAGAEGWPVADTVSLTTLQKETGWDRYRVRRVAEQGSGVGQDEFGRYYTRRSAFQIPEEGDLEHLLADSIPDGADRETGRWITWTQAREQLPGVNITTYESHTAVVRPGFGENGLATCYVWLDAHVERQVRKPTIEEAIAEAGLPPEAVADFLLRSEALDQLRERFGGPSPSTWVAAVKAGRIFEVKAQGRMNRRLRAWAYVPQEVLSSDEPAILDRFLGGGFRLAP